MSQRPIGKCALCLHTAELCNSHLLAKAAYKPLLSESGNRHPLVITGRSAYQTSRQAVDYLLCFVCEQRFRERGEDWVLARSYRGPGDFRFRDILRQHEGLSLTPQGTIYATANIPAFDLEKVVYFAASVFWRAAVHKWRRDDYEEKFELGPYEEPLRVFLLEDGSFPDGLVLRLWISSFEDRYCAVCHLPERGRKGGVRSYQFAIPGMTFEMMAGSHMSPVHYQFSTAPAPEGYVGIVPGVDQRDVADMIARIDRAAARSFVMRSRA